MDSYEEIKQAVSGVLGGSGSWKKISNEKLKFGKR